MVNVTSLLAKAGSGVGFSFGVRAWAEMEIWCVKGMYRLKLTSSEKNSGLTCLSRIPVLSAILQTSGWKPVKCARTAGSLCVR